MPGNSQRVYVGNLGNDIRERDLERFFKGFGKLSEISIKNGYGFVDFEDYRDADDAVHDLDGKDIRGSRYYNIKLIFFSNVFSISSPEYRVRVELARDRRDRDRGDHRGGGGGGRYNDRNHGHGGGGRRSPMRNRGGGGDRGGRGGDNFRRGNPPGRKTEYRLIVENLSSKTSWQVTITLTIFS